MDLRKKIIQYYLTNPVLDSEKNKYSKVMAKFGIDVKVASRLWIEVKKIIVDPKYKELINKSNIEPANYTDKEVKKILKQEGDNLTISVNVDYEVKSLNDLLEACEVDASKWEVVSWQCKKWDLGIKNKLDAIETKALYSVSAKFKAIPIEKNVVAQKDIILKELFKESPKNNKDLYEFYDILSSVPTSKDCLLELAIFDMHFGKLAHKEEAGEDYDIKIAVKRYRSAIKDLLSRLDTSEIDRILLPVGQDLVNSDNIQGTTTAGTPQDNDSRFCKVVRTVKEILIDVINELAIIAPVDVVIVVGNHDEQTTFLIGEMLDAYYHDTERVSVFNGASLRKYYRYGVTGIMLTHGNREKRADLGMIFAAENPKLWASVKNRYIQIGHLHHNNKSIAITDQEFQGFQVQIMPSLSGSDAWHRGKGFISQKQAKAFLFHKSKGLLAEYTYTDH